MLDPSAIARTVRRKRSAPGRRLGLAAAAVAGLCGAAHAEAPPSQAPGTIGLVMGDWHFGLFETANAKQECPDGMQFKQVQNYTAQFPTPEARKAREEAVGYYTNRGPNGENVFYFPMSVEDPLPFRAAQGPTAIGLNLDGEDAGKGAGYSLPHDNFTSPDGEKGVDNQLYRVIGCTPGWRKGGVSEGTVPQYLRSDAQGRILMEITGVDNEVNDNDVSITVYRGRDPVAIDTQNKVIPWLSQRIDYKTGHRYVFHFKGKIVGGVLITDPTDVLLPSYERNGMPGERLIKKMRLNIKLTPGGAEGLLGGYVDIENWYLMYAKTWGGHVLADIQGWSAPATYRALKQYADYKDPQTGQVSAISAAYQVSFARTFIVHKPQGDAMLAEGAAPAPSAAAVQTASR